MVIHSADEPNPTPEAYSPIVALQQENKRLREALQECIATAAACRRWLQPKGWGANSPSYLTYRQVWDASLDAEVKALALLGLPTAAAQGARVRAMGEIKAGDAVIITDAFGKEHRAAAVTGVEGTHKDGHKVHDFPVVMVVTPRSWEWERGAENPTLRPIPWPVEDVRPGPSPTPDDWLGAVPGSGG